MECSLESLTCLSCLDLQHHCPDLNCHCSECYPWKRKPSRLAVREEEGFRLKELSKDGS